MDKPHISICMIVKNEELNLKRCLDSFLPLINLKDDNTLRKLTELVVVDTGSTDRSVNIAKQYTDKVFIKEFVPWNFSDARNYGIAKAQGEKIIIVDADEQLKDQNTAYYLMDVLLNPKYDASPTIFLTIRNFSDKNCVNYSEMLQPRIFKNDGKPIYSFSVHNKPRTLSPYMFADHIIFNHYGYRFFDKELFKKKRDRSLPMLLEEYGKNNKDLHILTHLVKTYYAMKDWENVIKHGEDWIKLIQQVDWHDGWSAYLEIFVDLSSAYLIKNDTENAERIKNVSFKFSDRIVMLHFIFAQHYAANHDIEKARSEFERGLQIIGEQGNPFERLMTSNAKNMIPFALNWLAIYYHDKREYEKAGELLNRGIYSNDGMPLRWDVWNASHYDKKKEPLSL